MRSSIQDYVHSAAIYVQPPSTIVDHSATIRDSNINSEGGLYITVVTLSGTQNPHNPQQNNAPYPFSLKHKQ